MDPTEQTSASQPSTPAAPGTLPNPPGAVASLVCGILSIVLCWVPFAGLVLGIIAIVMASKAKKAVNASPGTYNPGGVRTAGFVCGIIGTVLSAIYLVYWLIAIAFVASVGDEFMDEFREEWERQKDR